MSFKYTTAISKLRKLKKQIKVVQGGASAGKTYGILPILIDDSIKKPLLRTWVVSCTYGHLESGAIADFKKIMMETNRWDDKCWHDTKHTYTFHNKSYIKFQATAQGKARGPRRDVLYINEANVGITFETYLELYDRTTESIWLDFNPTNEFWAHTEVLKDKDAEFLLLTYKDNEGLHENIIKKMELMREKSLTSNYWLNRWNVYGLGLVGKLEGVIFEDITIIDRIPSDAILLGYGIDFGFSNDPTAMVGIYMLSNGNILLDEVIYQKGMTPSDIAAKFKELDIDSKIPIFGDNSRPETIEEIKRYGYNISGATKGAGSIIYGISLMLEKTIYITKQSINTISEFDKYMWAVDKLGKSLNEPIDKYNHAIDAIRYFFLMKLTNKKPASKPFSFGKR